MIQKTSEKWLVDLTALTCQNTENQMVIGFEKRGKALIGKIKCIPFELLENWRKNQDVNQDVNKVIRRAVIEADEVFFKAYFNREIENKYAGTKLYA